MRLFKKKKKSDSSASFTWKITEQCLSMIAESAKSTHPNEFGGLIRRDDDVKDTLTEVVLLPGTISGNSHALFKMHMKPFDLSIVGTVHSHPSHSFQPSQADALLFRKYGRVHIIMAYPYSFDSWSAYDAKAEPITMHII